MINARIDITLEDDTIFTRNVQVNDDEYAKLATFVDYIANQQIGCKSATINRLTFFDYTTTRDKLLSLLMFDPNEVTVPEL